MRLGNFDDSQLFTKLLQICMAFMELMKCGKWKLTDQQNQAWQNLCELWI